MDAALKKQYIRLIYSKGFRYLSTALVICALVGGIYGSHPHFIFALCAAGAVLIGWGWAIYLRSTGMRLFVLNRGRAKKRIPYVHQRFKGAPPHRPAFLKDYRDFDDDLTSATAIDETVFSKKDAERARMLASVLCGALVIALSFVL